MRPRAAAAGECSYHPGRRQQAPGGSGLQAPGTRGPRGRSPVPASTIVPGSRARAGPAAAGVAEIGDPKTEGEAKGVAVLLL